MITFGLRYDDGRGATGVRLRDPDDIPAALEALGLVAPRPVLVLVGGAGGFDRDASEQVAAAFAEAVAPTVEELGASVVDGGTYAGVMRLISEARSASAATFPLVGVAAAGTVRLPEDHTSADGAAPLDPGHTHLLLVPGSEWGDETPWISRVAAVLAGPAPSMTLLVNGGGIAYADVEQSLSAERPVLVLDGSGRAADDIATAIRGDGGDERTTALAASRLVRAVPVVDRRSLARQLGAGLST